MTNILVVEDNAGLRRLIGIHLRRAGYEVSEAADGQAALDLLEHSRVHLIITDVMMPRLDGYGLIRELREAGDTTPVLMVTVKDSFDDMRTGFHAGADDYLTKPVNFEELLLRVGALLRRCGIQHSGEIAVAGARCTPTRCSSPARGTPTNCARGSLRCCKRCSPRPRRSSRARCSWMSSGGTTASLTRAPWTHTSGVCVKSSPACRILRSRPSAVSATGR